MSIIICWIVIGLLKIASSEKVCVYGSATGRYIDGIQGEYTCSSDWCNWDGNLGTSNNNFKMSASPSCGYDYLYVRYRQIGSKWRWEISSNLHENSYFYYKISTIIPWMKEDNQLHLTGWYDVNDQPVPGLVVVNAACTPSETKSYLTVTGYPGAYQGCNGQFTRIKHNLYQRTQGYDYGWIDSNGTSMLTMHYWLYNYPQQRWICDMRDWMDPSMNDYGNGCYCWQSSDGALLEFH